MTTILRDAPAAGISVTESRERVPQEPQHLTTDKRVFPYVVFVFVFAFITRDQNQGFLHAKSSGSYSTAGCVSKCDVRVQQLTDTSLTPEQKGTGLT